MGWLSSGIKEVIVYKSVSQNVFANLALEDWIFKNVELSWRRILFLWRNTPCVVIGRHQNPWLESNVPLLREKGVSLARRRSGGGTVYHDLGNLNCTVFTHRLDYNRPRNLWLVCDAINEGWSTRLHVNHRDDIICSEQWKVSGSSAKLAKDPAYHHFTLLLDVDTDNLHQMLRPHPSLHISQSSATNSLRSQIINLSSLVPDLNFENACSAIADKFYEVHNINGNIRKVIDIDPTCERTFPGITSLRQELEPWEWVYGKTPKFTVSASKEFPPVKLLFNAEVAHGLINSCSLSVNTDSPSKGGDTHTLPVAAADTLTVLVTDIEDRIKGSRFWCSDVERNLMNMEITHKSYSNVTEIIEWIKSFT